jgi:phosphate transport system protein
VRNAYLDQLDSVRDDLLALTRLVGNAAGRATTALLDGDREVAEQVILGDAHIDLLREQIEERSFELLSLQNPVARDLRMLVASLHMVGELERMGDLAVHVAKVARLRVPDRAIPADLAPLFARMGALCEVMVGKVEDIIADPRPDAARELEAVDEEMDRLRAQWSSSPRASSRRTAAERRPGDLQATSDRAAIGLAAAQPNRPEM